MSDESPNTTLVRVFRAALLELAEHWNNHALPETKKVFEKLPEVGAADLRDLADLLEQDVLVINTAGEEEMYLPDTVVGGVNFYVKCLTGEHPDTKDPVFLLRAEVHPLPQEVTPFMDELAVAMRDAAVNVLREHNIVTDAPPIDILPTEDEKKNMH